jgi:myo-inositol catabolism protein IolC
MRSIGVTPCSAWLSSDSLEVAVVDCMDPGAAPDWIIIDPGAASSWKNVRSQIPHVSTCGKGIVSKELQFSPEYKDDDEQCCNK